MSNFTATQSQVLGAGLSDTDLVLSCINGDITAFGELVKRYDRRLYRMVYHIIHDDSDIQDVVQEVFIKAFQNLKQLRAESKFSTWLYRIAINESLSELRRRRSKPNAVAEVPLGGDEEDRLPIDMSDWRPNPEEEYRQSELRDLLLRILQGLKPALRMVFVMRDIEGHSIEQTAAALGLTIPNVKSRLLRARLVLRERLTRHFKTHASPIVLKSLESSGGMRPSAERIYSAELGRLSTRVLAQPQRSHTLVDAF